MTDHPPMEASWVEIPPGVDNEATFYCVGGLIYAGGQEATITRITVQEDLPGLHCNMRRVCVWVDDALAFEAPMHAVQGVCYLKAESGHGD